MKSVLVIFALVFAIICNTNGAAIQMENSDEEIVDLQPDRCFLEPRSGTASCRANIDSWFFNYETGDCEQFVYGGCGGNLNRFPSKKMCERACSHFYKGIDTPIDLDKTKYNILNEVIDFRKLWRK